MLAVPVTRGISLSDSKPATVVLSIRANASLASLRVLVVTADVEIREKAAEMGFDGILLKPVTTAALEQTLLGNGRSAT